MTVGFKLGEQDDDEPSPTVVDGQASERKLSEQEHCDLFVSLCERLRAMGATEVRAENFRATFAPPATGNIVRVPIAAAPPQERAPKKDAEPLELFEDGKLSPDDRERRQRYRDIHALVGAT